MNNLSTTVKMLRKQYNLTQEELSLKSGVGLRFVRESSRSASISPIISCFFDMLFIH